jgi:catechol 2,3-dioxygenase-like lactoylglutathione lyase family enzyme
LRLGLKRSAFSAFLEGQHVSNTFVLKSLAPILLVDAIEPSLRFWTDGLGFALTTTVPETGPYVFAILARDGIEVMLQTRDSSTEDLGAGVAHGNSIVYFTVDALDPVLTAISAPDIAVKRRKTFYGADEIYLREPGGHIVGLAAPAAS